MPIRDTALMTMISDKSHWLTQRQRVIAQNVANANTPDYQARDLVPISFRDSLRQAERNLQLQQASTGVGFAASTAPDDFRVDRGRASYEVSPDKNQVVLEEQIVKMNQTQSEYVLALNLRRKFSQMYRTALGTPGGGR